MSDNDFRQAALDEFGASNNVHAAMYIGLGAVDQLAALVQEHRTANLIAATDCGVFDAPAEYEAACELIKARLGQLAPEGSA